MKFDLKFLIFNTLSLFHFPVLYWANKENVKLHAATYLCST